MEVTTQLNDLDDDSLSAIFAHLDLSDMINVAECDAHFIQSLRLAFQRKHRRIKIVLSSTMAGDKDSIVLDDDKIAVLLFSYFGQCIRYLVVDQPSEFSGEVQEAILTHCSKSEASLVNLDLIDFTPDCFNTISKPFKSIETLTVTDGTLSKKMSALNNWFPNLTSLKLLNVKFIDPTGVQHHWHAIQKFVVHNENEMIPQSSLIRMFYVNPTIRILQMRQKQYTYELIRTIRQWLLVEKLTLWMPEDGFMSFINDPIENFARIKEFSLNSAEFDDAPIEWLPFRFRNLTTLTLNGFNNYRGTLMNFVLQNKELIKLTLTPNYDEPDDLMIEDFTKIVDGLPKLVDLQCCTAQDFDDDELLKFAELGKKFPKFQISFYLLPV